MKNKDEVIMEDIRNILTDLLPRKSSERRECLNDLAVWISNEIEELDKKEL